MVAYGHVRPQEMDLPMMVPVVGVGWAGPNAISTQVSWRKEPGDLLATVWLCEKMLGLPGLWSTHHLQASVVVPTAVPGITLCSEGSILDLCHGSGYYAATPCHCSSLFL